MNVPGRRYGRRHPYTVIGIRRLPCVRCGGKAEFQWQACSDGNIWRPLCPRCDVAINKLVLKFMRDPDAKAKGERYAKTKLANED